MEEREADGHWAVPRVGMEEEREADWSLGDTEGGNGGGEGG